MAPTTPGIISIFISDKGRKENYLKKKNTYWLVQDTFKSFSRRITHFLSIKKMFKANPLTSRFPGMQCQIISVMD